MTGEWRDWTYAEYAKVPLENCVLLDETRLLGPIENGGLGYNVENLTQLHRLLVPYGGLRDIQLQAGETIIIAPATGAFGGRAVEVALAMGAQVSLKQFHFASHLLNAIGHCCRSQYQSTRETGVVEQAGENSAAYDGRRDRCQGPTKIRPDRRLSRLVTSRGRGIYAH
jgi:hypothetical protein